MTPDQFVAKYKDLELSEPQVSQSHFNDLCSILDVKNPIESDPTGQDYCFEKPVTPIAAASKGTGGFVDVWKRGHFAWEYKRKNKYKDLTDAHRQLYQYRDALDKPPWHVVGHTVRKRYARLIRAHTPKIPS